ncbi:MAG: hypothetical protein Q8L29_03900 [archaeon]|nr:hypothetical protein [archaeon]
MKIKRLNGLNNNAKRQRDEYLPRYRTPDYGVEAKDFKFEYAKNSFVEIFEERIAKFTN